MQNIRPKLVMGNWKMNGSSDSIQKLLNDLLDNIKLPTNATCVIFPPSLYIPFIAEKLKDSVIFWGAQNVYPKDKGAFTGEISGTMLLDYGCKYALVGHSERRQLFHEDENFIGEKFHHVQEHGMIPVLCVGETLDEREQGLTEEVLRRQLAPIANKKDSFKSCVVAYEPVWAIGTGKTASPEQAQEVHKFIRSFVSDLNPNDANKLPIVYGGSVNESNAAQLFAMPDIDGGLIGGASLNAMQFLEIIKCIN